MIFLAAALVLGATVLPARWVLTRYDSLGRSRPFPAISTTLCLALAVVCLVPVVRHARLEHRLTAAAEQVGGEQVAVHCQSAGGAAVDAGAELGYVEFGADGRPEHRTLLKWQPCRDLSDWLGSDQRQGTGFDPATARSELIAVHVLSHETMHMIGRADEALAECGAMQRDAAMAEALGASRAYADAFARWYWSTVYPQMPDTYRSAECRAGGSMDEHRADPPWAAPA